MKRGEIVFHPQRLGICLVVGEPAPGDSTIAIVACIRPVMATREGDKPGEMIDFAIVNETDVIAVNLPLELAQLRQIIMGPGGAR